MLANTLQHGDATENELIINVKPEGKGYLFTYSDSSIHPENGNSGTGIKLIEQLIRRVSGKDYKLEASTGTYAFSFLSD